MRWNEAPKGRKENRNMERNYTPQEAAEVFRIKPGTMWKWIREKRISAVPLENGRYIITQKAIDEKLAASTTASSERASGNGN